VGQILKSPHWKNQHKMLFVYKVVLELNSCFAHYLLFYKNSQRSFGNTLASVQGIFDISGKLNDLMIFEGI
jgi:hypothetical protein